MDGLDESVPVAFGRRIPHRRRLRIRAVPPSGLRLPRGERDRRADRADRLARRVLAPHAVTDTERPRFFFIHLMKTGGTSFVFQMLQNFEPDEVYPSALDRDSPTDVTPYASIPKMLALSPERRARIRVYAGHMPYVASELLGIDVIRLTLLRDPVDRTISMLKHVKRLFERYTALSDRGHLRRRTRVPALSRQLPDQGVRAYRRGATRALAAGADATPKNTRTIPRRNARGREIGADRLEALRARQGESRGGGCRGVERALRRLPRRASLPLRLVARRPHSTKPRANVSSEDWEVPSRVAPPDRR